MPVQVETHPEFNARQATYRANKQAAIAQGDEVAQAQADAQWSLSLSEMKSDLYERQDRERDRTAAIARIKAENPAAPEELFNGTDLVQIEAAAKAVQAVAAQHSTGSWSPSPSGGAPPTSAEPNLDTMTPAERNAHRQAELDAVSRSVMQGEGTVKEWRANVEKMKQLSLRPLNDPQALSDLRQQQAEQRRTGRA